jgi:transcriptional regulator with XRE-family HTH domain
MTSNVVGAIRYAVLESDESLRSLARKAGVNVSVVSRFACGRDISVDNLTKLARAVGCAIAIERLER